MTKSTITREQLLEIIETDHVQCGEASYLARMALAAMDSEHKRNPVLAYADSYRDMAKQGVESVPIWSVITDLERNIAPLYRHAQPAPVVPEEKPIPNTLSMYAVDAVAAIAEVKGWNACRAAMLAAAPQAAPVVPDEKDKTVDADDHPLLWSFNEGWNACRAAMLAAAQQEGK
ncbi:hypothetical protein M4C20_01220 [Klebsiella pneumoniae]|nr:hypothetical protein [Klebsiella pneumoniae]